MADIGQMSDDDLRQQLKEYGVDVGPIVSTTRLFYEKKLGKLMESGGQPHPETESEEDYDEDDDEEVQFNYQPAPVQSTPPRQRRPPVEASPPRQKIQAAEVPQRRPPVEASPPRQKIQAAEIPQMRQRPQTAHTPITQARRAEPTLYSSINTPQSALSGKPAGSGAKTPAKSSSGGGLAMWIKLMLIVVMAALVYLVIVNMNPSAQNKIPSRLEDSRD